MRAANPKNMFCASRPEPSPSSISPSDNDLHDDYRKRHRQLALSRFADGKRGHPARQSRAGTPGDPSPIKHVIYIVQENRTYDQVLGDMKKGNGDPSLVLFGENVTPESPQDRQRVRAARQLLRQLRRQRRWPQLGHRGHRAGLHHQLSPNSYAGRRKDATTYEGQETANRPPAGYLWTNAHEAGITMRELRLLRQQPQDRRSRWESDIERSRDPVLGPVTNPNYRAFDLDYPDIERAKVFIKDLGEFENDGQMPQAAADAHGQRSHLRSRCRESRAAIRWSADNDQGVGMVVEAVSKSQFWNETAIFIIEDDAQNGRDHVDSHRSPAYLISPCVKRGAVDSSMYNTTSVLRTMEFILGLHPMTILMLARGPCSQLAEHARPEALPRREAADPAGHAAIPPPPPRPRRTAEMDFSQEDRIDDDELNAILWAAIKGPNVPLPAPVRSRFAH